MVKDDMDDTTMDSGMNQQEDPGTFEDRSGDTSMEDELDDTRL